MFDPQKILVWSKNSFGPNIFCPRNFVSKRFWPQKILGPKRILGLKIWCNKFLFKNILCPNIFGQNEFCAQKSIRLEKCWVQKNCRSQIFLDLLLERGLGGAVTILRHNLHGSNEV